MSVEQKGQELAAFTALRTYLLDSIGSFKGDPPDSDFQHGYLSALWAVYGDCFMTQEERAAAHDAARAAVTPIEFAEILASQKDSAKS